MQRISRHHADCSFFTVVSVKAKPYFSTLFCIEPFKDSLLSLHFHVRR